MLIDQIIIQQYASNISLLTKLGNAIPVSYKPWDGWGTCLAASQCKSDHLNSRTCPGSCAMSTRHKSHSPPEICIEPTILLHLEFDYFVGKISTDHPALQWVTCHPCTQSRQSTNGDESLDVTHHTMYVCQILNARYVRKLEHRSVTWERMIPQEFHGQSCFLSMHCNLVADPSRTYPPQGLL